MRSAAALPSSVADSLSGCGQERTEAPPPCPDPHLNYLQCCRILWERRFGNLLLPSATAAPSRPLPEFAAPPATAGFFPQQKVAPSAPCPHVNSSPWLIKMFLPAAPSSLSTSASTNGLLCKSGAHSTELSRLPFSYI